MLKNYFILSFRNIIRQPVYSVINILGLAIGIAVFLTIMMYVHFELSFDKFHSNLDRIYQVKMGEGNSTPSPLGGFLKQKFPEIENFTRFYNEKNATLNYKNSLHNENILYADPAVLDIFSFPVIQGNKETAFESPYSLVLTKSTVDKIFGDTNPIGETIKYNNEYEFTVTAVIRDIPANSSIAFNGICAFSDMEKMSAHDYSNDWQGYYFQTYLLISKGCDVPGFLNRARNQILEFAGIKTETEQAKKLTLDLTPIQDLYFTDIDNNTKHGNYKNLIVFSAIAFLILVLAIINFINLTTATGTNRAKEIGLRKISGTNKRQLIIQLLFETFITCSIAFFMALIIIEIFMPLFNTLIGFDLSLGYLSNPFTILILLFGIVIIAIISGIYPSLYLSKFKHVEIISGHVTRGVKGSLFRKVLIIFQFFISITLITGILLVSKQLNYINKKDLGFNKDQVVWFKMNDELAKNITVFKENLLRYPDILGFSASRFNGPVANSFWEINYNNNIVRLYVIVTDPEFINLFQIDLIEGRNFSKAISTDRNRTVLLNEAAVNKLGLVNPIGKVVNDLEVIGVTRDYFFQPLYNKIEPLVIVYMPDYYTYTIANIKISGNHVNKTLSQIQSVWNQLSPGFLFTYHFLDDSLDALYQAEENFMKIIKYFSVLALFIACLGLFGMVLYTSMQRTKEIGIRKTNGANTWEIMLMLSKDFTQWVIIAFIIACPVAYLALNKWLQNFAYRTNLSWWIFAMAGIMALIVALITASWLSWRAASRNPVEALRYE